MTTFIGHRVLPAVVAGAAAVAVFALFEAAHLSAGGAPGVAGPVRLVDQTTDVPAPPGDLVPPGAVLPPGTMIEPGGLPLPPLPPGVVLPPEVPQMLAQAAQVLASPPPNVPNEVCRYNTVRIPC